MTRSIRWLGNLELVLLIKNSLLLTFDLYLIDKFSKLRFTVHLVVCRTLTAKLTEIEHVSWEENKYQMSQNTQVSFKYWDSRRRCPFFKFPFRTHIPGCYRKTELCFLLGIASYHYQLSHKAVDRVTYSGYLRGDKYCPTMKVKNVIHLNHIDRMTNFSDFTKFVEPEKRYIRVFTGL